MRHLGICLVAIALVACAKKTDAPAAGTEKTEKAATAAKKAKPAAKKTEAAKPAAKKAGGALDLTKFKLKADAPAGAKVGDAIVGEGHMIQGPGIVVGVQIANDMHPKTVEKAKEDADMYSPLNLKTEKLADGWAMTFENKGGMGTNYWVQVRREIGGKSYWCDTTAAQPAQQANALATCKSLRP